MSQTVCTVFILKYVARLLPKKYILPTCMRISFTPNSTYSRCTYPLKIFKLMCNINYFICILTCISLTSKKKIESFNFICHPSSIFFFEFFAGVFIRLVCSISSVLSLVRVKILLVLWNVGRFTSLPIIWYGLNTWMGDF